jgi:hypothetical protein
MVCHLLDALRRHAAPAEHVREEGPHVGGSEGPAEGDDEHGVER